MISLEQAKQLIGMPALTPATGHMKITKIRQMNDGKILAYNKHGWCCDVNVLRNTEKQQFNFDKVEQINEGDSKNE